MSTRADHRRRYFTTEEAKRAFASTRAILEDLRDRGEIDVEDDVAVMTDPTDGERFAIAPPLLDWCDAWDRIAARSGKRISTAAQRRLGASLADASPIDADELDAAIAELDVQQRFYCRLPWKLIDAEVTTAVLRAAVENAGLAG